ncbi:MAG TPA: hypothetical protein VGN00_14710 [Puia sp.]|jgi:hypothetical protein
MNFIKSLIPAGSFLGLFLLGSLPTAYAQSKLDKKISVSIHQRPLAQALAEIGRKGGVVFSYNTTILNGDSLVNAEADGMTVRQVLVRLLGDGYDYSENGKYVIILQRPKAPPNIPPVRSYMISGYVKDETTREKIGNASVYESDQLVSTLTDTNGFFRLRLKERSARSTTIIISKQFYRDTVLFVQPGSDQQLVVPIGREKISNLSPFVVTNRVEKTWLGRFFLSSRSMVQSLNLADFFAKKPVQMSLTPGLGTHGRMSGQVVNKISLNIVGGYTAGMNGVELAGVFNLDKNAVGFVQAAGVVNVVGGKVEGVQLAGVDNSDLDSVVGVQAAGVSNVVKGAVTGVQLAGVVNISQGEVKGVQAGGVVNVSHKVNGVQVGGIANVSQEVNGVQVGGVVNYTRRLRGVQIGLVNIADSSSGFMVGLVNIVKNGVHEFTVSSNEMTPLNISYRTGSRGMYSILELGFDPGNNEKVYNYGIGIGNEARLSSRLALNTEGLLYNFIVGHDRNLPLVVRLQSLLRVKLGKVSFFAGPALSMTTSSDEIHLSDGYRTVLPRAGYHTFPVGNVKAWVGWTAGINIF